MSRSIRFTMTNRWSSPKHRHAEVVHIYLPGDEQFVEVPSGSVPV
ncbi:MAG: hypothetical protein ABSG28_01500 [Methanoregula sp.]